MSIHRCIHVCFILCRHGRTYRCIYACSCVCRCAFSDEWTAQHRQDRTLEKKSTDESANIENRRSLCFSFESSRFDGACFKARSYGQCSENSSKIVVRSFRRTTPSGTEPIEATRTIRVSFPLARLKENRNPKNDEAQAETLKNVSPNRNPKERKPEARSKPRPKP